MTTAAGPTTTPCARLRVRVRSRHGFTIIELLTVIAVIGILIGIFIPTLGKVRENAKKAKTRVQFSQWANAIEGFRTEYGYYPAFSGDKVNGDGTANDDGTSNGSEVLFRELLSGKGSTASGAFQSSSASTQNKKRIGFVSFGQDDVNPSGRVIDAFENTDITVLVDSDLDGIIQPGAINSAPVAVPGGSAVLPPEEKVPSTGVRAGVIFFSAGSGSARADVVTSW